MSKITNNGLIRSGTGILYSCTRMATVGVKGIMLNSITASDILPLTSASSGGGLVGGWSLLSRSVVRGDATLFMRRKVVVVFLALPTAARRRTPAIGIDASLTTVRHAGSIVPIC